MEYSSSKLKKQALDTTVIMSGLIMNYIMGQWETLGGKKDQ